MQIDWNPIKIKYSNLPADLTGTGLGALWVNKLPNLGKSYITELIPHK